MNTPSPGPFFVRTSKNGIYRALLLAPTPYDSRPGVRIVDPDEANGMSEGDAEELLREVDSRAGLRLAANEFTDPEIASFDFPKKRVALVATWPTGDRVFMGAWGTLAEAKGHAASVAVDFRQGRTSPPALYEVEPFKGPTWRDGDTLAPWCLVPHGNSFAWEKVTPGLRVPFKCPPGTLAIPPTASRKDDHQKATIGTDLWAENGMGGAPLCMAYTLRATLPEPAPDGVGPLVVTTYGALYHGILSRNVSTMGADARHARAFAAVTKLPEVRDGRAFVSVWRGRGCTPSPYLCADGTPEGVATLYAIHKRSREIGD